MHSTPAVETARVDSGHSGGGWANVGDNCNDSREGRCFGFWESGVGERRRGDLASQNKQEKSEQVDYIMTNGQEIETDKREHVQARETVRNT